MRARGVDLFMDQINSKRRRVETEDKIKIKRRVGIRDFDKKRPATSSGAEESEIETEPPLSPSRFHEASDNDDENSTPEQIRVNTMLGVVASMYYPNKYVHGDGEQMWEVVAGSDGTAVDMSSLEMLTSSLREPSILDDWTPHEIGLFEAGITSLGKDFHAIQRLIPSKSATQVISFYYHWKQSSHYLMWKALGRPFAKFHSGKLEQWQLINSKMALLRSAPNPSIPGTFIRPRTPFAAAPAEAKATRAGCAAQHELEHAQRRAADGDRDEVADDGEGLDEELDADLDQGPQETGAAE